MKKNWQFHLSTLILVTFVLGAFIFLQFPHGKPEFDENLFGFTGRPDAVEYWGWPFRLFSRWVRYELKSDGKPDFASHYTPIEALIPEGRNTDKPDIPFVVRLIFDTGIGFLLLFLPGRWLERRARMRETPRHDTIIQQ